MFKNKDFKEKFWTVITIIILCILIHLCITCIWNGIMPRIFGLPKISVWDLFGLCCITRWILPPINNVKK